MAESYEKLGQALVPTVALISVPSIVAHIYESGVGVQTILKHIRVVSISGAPSDFRMWHADAGVSPASSGATANLIFPPMTIDAGGMAEFEGTILVDSLDRIYVATSVASSIIVTLYGLKKS